jgi:KUP system potassium uptake protein
MSQPIHGVGEHRRSAQSSRLPIALGLGALGVVFGDIGTSPLYTMKECRGHLPAGVDATAGILGVLSLMIWALVLVVCVKYVLCVTRADNEGEGGIFALLARLHRTNPARDPAPVGWSTLLILAGAALLYGDGVITPAISVLGAAEGLSAIDARFDPFIPGIAAVILGGLFWFQSHGTDRIGRIFGPVMLAWFVVLGLLGLAYVVPHPAVLAAINPLHGLRLLQHQPAEVSALLGAVVLTITGAEALYADLGHFGRRAIAWAWYGAALPGLLLNYLGQGAYLLAHPAATENPFYALAPQGPIRAALTALAFAAAIIASQALISGAYSLTRQAIQLGYFPRLRVVYTNAAHSGQIYVPFVNWALAIGCIATTLGFKSTANLAAAYGIAVTGTMAITTFAFYLVARREWQWSRAKLVPICALFLVIDLAFFVANARKTSEGGWLPIVIALALLVVMHTWKVGRGEIARRLYGHSVNETELLAIARSRRLARVRGAVVFMAGTPRGAPTALLHHVKSNRALHETVLLLSLTSVEVPLVPDEERLTLTEIGAGLWRVVGRYGYMESPDATALLDQVAARGVKINPGTATYVFNREMVIADGDGALPRWQKYLYGFLSRNAQPAKDYFHIPPSQIIEIGLPVHL